MTPTKPGEVFVSIRADASELLEAKASGRRTDDLLLFQFALMRVSSSRSQPKT